jgi:hypothetical protein
MARRKAKKGGGGWVRWLGGAVVFVAVVATVTVVSLQREGRVYHPEPPVEVEARGRILVEVLNGCGARGAARIVADELRLRGFDVVRIGNAEDFGYAFTVVVDRSGAGEKAEAVAKSMGCERLIQQVATDAYLDVTVVLGADGLWRQGLLGRSDWHR